MAGSGSGESGGDARKREALTGRFVGGWMDGWNGWMDGAREGNRTLDLRITSALLCRLSYPGVLKLLLAKVEGGKLAKSHPGSVADLLDRWLDDEGCAHIPVMWASSRTLTTLRAGRPGL